MPIGTVFNDYVVHLNVDYGVTAKAYTKPSLAFLDLYHGSGMRPWNDTVKAALFSDGDGIHPNNDGIKWFAPMIREFVKTLM